MRTFVGPNSLVDSLQQILSEHSCKRIFLVTGKSSFKASQAHTLLAPILHDYEVCFFDDYAKNPELSDARKGIQQFHEFTPDMVIALGGGSAIDIAKVINFAAAQPVNLEELLVDVKNAQAAKIPLVAIPTTAGTGSEATHFAVLYRGNKKFSLAHSSILPQYAIVDSHLTHNLPGTISAHTALDAYCQAIESFWAVSATEESQQYAEKGIHLISQAIVEVVTKPTAKAREQMMLGAHYAGKAINISKTTAAHALSYPITKLFGIPHGYAVALTLGEFFTINTCNNNSVINDPRGREYVEATLAKLYHLLGCQSAQEAKTNFQRLLEKLHLASSLSTYDAQASAMKDSLIPLVNIERLTNNPIKVSKEQIIQAYGIN